MCRGTVVLSVLLLILGCAEQDAAKRPTRPFANRSQVVTYASGPIATVSVPDDLLVDQRKFPELVMVEAKDLSFGFGIRIGELGSDTDSWYAELTTVDPNDPAGATKETIEVNGVEWDLLVHGPAGAGFAAMTRRDGKVIGVIGHCLQYPKREMAIETLKCIEPR